MTNFSGFFREWTFNQYTIEDTQSTRELWVANGFLFFKDDGHGTSLLNGLSFFDRWALWMEYRRECRLRLLDKNIAK